MLGFLRDGAQSSIIKWLLLTLMALAVLGLVFIDMTGAFRGGVSASSVARIGDTEISTMQLRQDLQQAERRTGSIEITQEMREQLAYQVINNEIRRRLLLLEARNLGLSVSDSLAATEILKQLKPLTEKGLTAEQALSRTLQATGMSEDQLVYVLKQDMVVSQLMRSVSNGYAPAEMVDLAYSYRNQARGAKIMTLKKSRFEKDIPPPSDEQLQAFYDANLSNYMTPEYREISYVILDEDKLTASIDLSEENLRHVYKENLDDYTLPPRRIVDQAVFKSAKAAQDVLAGSTDAASLIAAVKQQPADSYVLLENESVTKQDATTEIVKAAFATPVGEIVGPIETSLGWIVIAVKSEEAETVQSFEAIREELAKTYRHEQSADLLYNTANEIDEMLANGVPLSEIAAEHGLNVFQTPLMTAEGKTMDNKSAELLQQDFAEMLLAEAFTLQEGEMPLLLETEDARFIAYTASAIKAPAARPLKDVHDKLSRDWHNAQLTQKLNLLTDEIIKKAESGITLTEIAETYDLGLKTQAPVTAAEAQKSDSLSPPVAALLFSIKDVGDIQKTADGENIVFVELSEISFPDSDIPDAEKVQFKNLIAARIRADLLAQYEMALREKYNVEISDRAIQQTIRPAESF